VTVGVIVGNPKPASRTLAAAVHVARQITGAEPDLIIDVIELGPGLLRFGDTDVAHAVASVRSMDLIVVASPTYKATFTGVLKLFLDQFSGGALEGVVAVPLMLGAGPGHALAPEVFLKPLLAELGASTPTGALYLLEDEWQTSPTLTAWLPGARAIITFSLSSPGRAR
jgi:FMN reductase